MNDKPPERRRRPQPPAVRVRFSGSAAIVVLVAALWVLSDRKGVSDSVFDTADILNPIGGPWVAIAALIAALVLNWFYIAAETAIELIRPIHVRHARDKNGRQGDRLQWILDRRPGLIAACNLGRQMAKLAMVFICLLLAPSITGLLQPPTPGTTTWEPSYGTVLLSALLLLIPVGAVTLVTELVPKSYATLHPHRVALRLTKFTAASAALFAIPAALITATANLLTSRFGGKASFDIENQAEEEIKTLVVSAQESGEMESEERELLHSVFEFSDTVAREVMTPRVDLDSMPIASTPKEILDVIVASGHSRIPLYEGTDDQIVGIVHAKDLLVAINRHADATDIRELLRPALFVPENKNLHDLLREMRHGRAQMAIVQDEFGGTSGVVTIEDIVEELVGDIVDEYDVEEPEIVPDEGGYLVGGKAHVDEVNAALGSDLHSAEFDTIGGYVFGLFGRQPKLGDCIDSEDLRFCIVETDGRRIMRLHVERIQAQMQYDLVESAE